MDRIYEENKDKVATVLEEYESTLGPLPSRFETNDLRKLSFLVDAVQTHKKIRPKLIAVIAKRKVALVQKEKVLRCCSFCNRNITILIHRCLYLSIESCSRIQKVAIVVAQSSQCTRAKERQAQDSQNETNGRNKDNQGEVDGTPTTWKSDSRQEQAHDGRRSQRRRIHSDFGTTQRPGQHGS